MHTLHFRFLLYKKPRFLRDDFYAAQNAHGKPFFRCGQRTSDRCYHSQRQLKMFQSPMSMSIPPNSLVNSKEKKMSHATRNARKNLVAERLPSRYPHPMDISLKSLQEALGIRHQIAALEQRLSTVLGASASTRGGKRRMSPQARAKIAATMGVRWARKESRTGRTSPAKRKGGITAAGRKRLSQLMKARWAARKRSVGKK